MKKKHPKSEKQLKIITQELKTIENPNTDDIKSVNIEHTKSFQILFKIIRQATNVSPVGSYGISNIHLYNEGKKCDKFLNEKKCKNSKEITCF